MRDQVPHSIQNCLEKLPKTNYGESRRANFALSIIRVSVKILSDIISILLCHVPNVEYITAVQCDAVLNVEVTLLKI